MPLRLAVVLALLGAPASAEIVARKTATLPGNDFGAFSRDGSLYARTADGQIEIFDAATGSMRAILKLEPRSPSLYGGWTLPLAFTPDGKKLIGVEVRIKSASVTPPRVSQSSRILMWDLETEKLVRSLKDVNHCFPTGSAFQPTQCGEVGVGGFSPDGRVVSLYVVEWWNTDRTEKLVPMDAALVDLVSGSVKKQAGPAYLLKDGRTLVLTASPTHCELQDLATGKRVSFLAGCTAHRTPAISPDGRTLAAMDPPTAWDVDTGVLKFALDGPKDLWAPPGFTADSRLLLAARAGLRAWDLETGKEAGFVKEPAWGDYGQWSLAPGGGYIAAASSMSPVMTTLHEVRYGGVPALPAVVAAPVPAPAALDLDAAPAGRTEPDANAYAVVIGVERYRQEGLPRAEYAARDAKAFHSYLTQAMGFDSKNVALLTDEQATRGDLEKYLGPWLANRVDERSRVFVYFSGHGAPNPKTGEGFLMPYEGDPSYPEVTAVSVKQVYQALAKLPTKNVTVVLDACFSGQGERSLIAKGTRPLVNLTAVKPPDGLVVLAAATGSQVSVSQPESRHGLLTHFILEGLHGKADANGDKAVTTSELYGYVRPAVERAARRQNQEQTPTLAPAPEALGPAAGGTWLRLK